MALSAAGLVLFSPIIGLIWWRIRRDADGPVLYAGKRVGLGGREFKMYKFRTMVSNADRMGGPSTSDDDPRLTKTGQMLRRYKLDELPQLVNVLKGEMSFVGPRPEVPREVERYSGEERLLLSVRPGITDWASLRFYNEGEILKGHSDPHAAYLQLIRPEKIRLGLEYVKQGTFKDDFMILAKTMLLPWSVRAKRPTPNGPGADFTTVTETWGLPASPEQFAMAYCRYKVAGDISEGKEVLEIGCGTGMGLAYLKQRAARVVGGDITTALVDEARRRVPDVEVVQLDAQRLPFDDASFDVVLMLEMIYYVPDLDRAFSECRRVLRSTGRLLVCLPNRDRPDFNSSPFSMHYPNVPELANLFERHSFKPQVSGGFPVEPVSVRDRLVQPLRHVAIRLHLIPRSMHAKAVLKRLLYGRLPRLDAIRDRMAEFPPLVKLDGHGGTDRFKNLYAIGELAH